MSLDKQIKEVATGQVDALVADAAKALAKVVKDAEISVPDLARLVSEHKTKSTHDKCVKAVAEKISKDMLATMSGSDDS